MRQRVCRPQRSQVLGTRAGQLRPRPARKSLASCSMQSRQPRSCSAVSLFFTRELVPLSPAEERRRGDRRRWPANSALRRAPWRRPARPALLPRSRRKSGIERQLHVVGPGQLPRVGRDVAGFVVDHQQRTVLQPVHPVQAQIKRQSGDVDGALDLGLRNLEFDARGLVLQPLGDQPREPLRFQFQIAAGHLFAEVRAQLPLPDARCT